MRTKNAMRLKARISNMAKEAGIPAQAMMQSYLLERLLERLAESPWRDNVVIKGGVLISSLVGVGSRTTMDLDTTVRGLTSPTSRRRGCSVRSRQCRQTTTRNSSSTGQKTSGRPMTIPASACTSRRTMLRCPRP